MCLGTNGYLNNHYVYNVAFHRRVSLKSSERRALKSVNIQFIKYNRIRIIMYMRESREKLLRYGRYTYNVEIALEKLCREEEKCQQG